MHEGIDLIIESTSCTTFTISLFRGFVVQTSVSVFHKHFTFYISYSTSGLLTVI